MAKQNTTNDKAEDAADIVDEVITEAEFEETTTQAEANTQSTTVLSSDEKNIATITHLGGIVLFFIPSLAIWLLKKDDSTYIETQAREALNFQITVMIAMFAANILVWLLIGFLLIPAIWLANILFSILAAIATSKGEDYRYPFSLRLLN